MSAQAGSGRASAGQASVAEVLAARVAALGNEGIPAPVRERCRDLLVDVAGLCVAARFEAVAAHYRGIGPAIIDILAGQTQMMMPGLAAGLPNIRNGKLRPIAITGLARHPLLPEVPTFEESGYKGFDGVQWYGIVGPAKLPDAITRRLNAEINKSLATRALKDRLSGEAIEPMPMSPGQFAGFIQADIARWSALARERKISLDD